MWIAGFRLSSQTHIFSERSFLLDLSGECCFILTRCFVQDFRAMIPSARAAFGLNRVPPAAIFETAMTNSRMKSR